MSGSDWSEGRRHTVPGMTLDGSFDCHAPLGNRDAALQEPHVTCPLQVDSARPVTIVQVHAEAMKPCSNVLWGLNRLVGLTVDVTAKVLHIPNNCAETRMGHLTDDPHQKAAITPCGTPYELDWQIF